MRYFKSFGEFCGGFSKMPDKLLSGGPMMGRAQWNTAVPVTKTVGGILALSAPMQKASPCIRCGKCTEACPMSLIPSELHRSVEKGDLNTAKLFDIGLCSECGACAYVCPAKRNLVQMNRLAKGRLRTYQQKQKEIKEKQEQKAKEGTTRE